MKSGKPIKIIPGSVPKVPFKVPSVSKHFIKNAIK